ncbi:hypothetical protein GJ744_002959 [Endocarpon pusillum]|uniref:Uncharacterized protein n=1 Tax=Endocarpon pusillum TaxID=364733 RepID=A0A8H7A7C2_9EURO|nr:hypothetical protein GJ744_002959 [Endocarpon pusillum]
MASEGGVAAVGGDGVEQLGEHGARRHDVDADGLHCRSTARPRVRPPRWRSRRRPAAPSWPSVSARWWPEVRVMEGLKGEGEEEEESGDAAVGGGGRAK